jgi:hypothetical protein
MFPFSVIQRTNLAMMPIQLYLLSTMRLEQILCALIKDATLLGLIETCN